MTSVHLEAEDEKSRTRRRSPREDGGRDWSDAAKECLGTTRSWRKQGTIVPWSLQREHCPAAALISDF